MTSSSTEKPNSVPAGEAFDVVIAGAGLIGTTSACLFAQQGFKVALVETQRITTHTDANANTDARVTSINLAAHNLFQALEVWQKIDPNCVGSYRAMKVWDRGSSAKISFHASDIAQPYLGYIVENHAIRAALMEKLHQNYHVTVMENTSVVGIDLERNDSDPSALTVTLSNGSIETGLLVGADGSHSPVRELCDIPAPLSDFAQDAIVATVSTSRSHRATAWQCFLETGPAAMLPLADGRCSLVWSCDRDKADELMQLEDAEFCARLQPLFLHELGEIRDCQPRQRFQIGQHHAKSYIADSVALIGDAAHSLHPLAGLGANIGLMDAAALAEVVSQARNSGKRIGQHSVLRRYERWRKGDNALALAMMKGFKDIFGSQFDTAKAVRSVGMNLVDSIAPLKITTAKLASGLQGDVPAVCRTQL